MPYALQDGINRQNRMEYTSLQWVQELSGATVLVGDSVDFTHAAGYGRDLLATGSVRCRYLSWQRRTAGLNLVNRTGIWTPGDPGARVAINSLLDIFRKVQLPDSSWATVPLGRYMFGNPRAASLAGKSEVQLELYDKWLRYTKEGGGVFQAPFRVHQGDDLVGTIKSVAQTFGETLFDLVNPGTTIPGDMYWPEGTEGAEVLKWLVGCLGMWELFYTTTGYLRLQQRIDPVAASSLVADYTGSRFYLGSTREPLWSELFNTVLVTGALANSTTIRATAQYTDQSSPYNASVAPAGIGPRVKSLLNQSNIWSQTYANNLAQWELQRSVALNERVQAKMLPDWARGEGDVVTYTDPANGVKGKYQLLNMDWPLGLGEAQFEVWRAKSLTAGVTMS